ncbi:acyltransferase family protein [Paractinoplanes globisporus]|uniref:Acyltransferase family protein n=1 Tax=Paractinoplanes globisporus TaxID=113565 RepID=A0ABW6W4E2_9ACTN|nr:acyltransferase [Actinoplanes globisporus]
MTSPAPVRLAWLDALRGYAALVVVLFHLSPSVIGTDRHLAIYRHFDAGKYGVLLFFLVSGYVIPMSLERHGSLRRFWIGRLCRIYPAYLAAIAVVVLLSSAGWLAWSESMRHQTVTTALAHVTMMSDLVGVRGAVRVFWTLSYEMTFYLVVSGLFVWRLHRHSAWWAAGLGLTALVFGAGLPNDLLGAGSGARRTTAAILVVLVGLSILAYLKDRLVPAAGAAGIALVLLPAVNGHATRESVVIASWQGILLLAIMFAGTVVYRWQHAQIGGREAAFALTVVALSVIGAHWTHLGTAAALRLWAANVGAVALTFLFAYAMRNRTVPSVFTWLGRISYSLYLLHVIVLLALPRVVPDLGTRGIVFRATAGVAYLLVALVTAWLAYRMVEQPGQRLGRRIAAKLEPRPAGAGSLATQRAAPRTGQGENERQSV